MVSKRLRFILLIGMAGLLLLLPASSLAGGPPPAQGVRMTPMGHPTWSPADLHLFSAPIGTAASGYVEFAETALAILPPPNHVAHPVLMVGPGAPHAPPYTSEMAAGVAAQGYHQGVRFSGLEYSEGMGVFLVWMNVPAPGTTGSSPDFASGPIIANALFPIHVEAITNRNGRIFNPYVFTGDVPALNTVGFSVDGASHFPMYIADNADFGPTGTVMRGSYEYVITMVDTTGNGWRIEAHFAIAP